MIIGICILAAVAPFLTAGYALPVEDPAEVCPEPCLAIKQQTCPTGEIAPNVSLTIVELSKADGHADEGTCNTCPGQACKLQLHVSFAGLSGSPPHCFSINHNGSGWEPWQTSYSRIGWLKTTCNGPTDRFDIEIVECTDTSVVVESCFVKLDCPCS